MLAAVIHPPLFFPKCLHCVRQDLLPTWNMQLQKEAEHEQAKQPATGNLWVWWGAISCKHESFRPIYSLRFAAISDSTGFHKSHRSQEQLPYGVGCPQTLTIHLSDIAVYAGNSDLPETVFLEIHAQCWLRSDDCTKCLAPEMKGAKWGWLPSDGLPWAICELGMAG